MKREVRNNRESQEKKVRNIFHVQRKTVSFWEKKGEEPRQPREGTREIVKL